MSQKSSYFHKFLCLVTSNIITIGISCCALLFIYLLIQVRSQDILRIDVIAYHLAVRTMRTSWLTPLMEGLSALSSPVVLLTITLVIGAFVPGKKPVQCTCVNLIAIVLINQIFKFIIQRPRPVGYRLIAEIGYSFPSGHSMVAVAFFGFLAWIVLKTNHTKSSRIFYASSFALLAVLIGFSRIYLGVHYASDVLAGFCVSCIWLAIFTKTIAPLFLPKLAAGDFAKENGYAQTTEHSQELNTIMGGYCNMSDAPVNRHTDGSLVKQHTNE